MKLSAYRLEIVWLPFCADMAEWGILCAIPTDLKFTLPVQGLTVGGLFTNRPEVGPKLVANLTRGFLSTLVADPGRPD
jgi:hypothetical protein